MANISLLDNPVRVSVPFVKVTIGDYTFGIFKEAEKITRDSKNGVYRIHEIQYPNYIQSLSVAKINGQVNTYTLTLIYPVTADNDPNFFEKVFSSVSSSRKIIFSYGDLQAPTFIYREEEAIITDVRNQFNLGNASIQYTVTAVSSGRLATAGAFNFPGYNSAKPSDIIKSLLKNNAKYGLLDLFKGMRDLSLVEQNNLIASDDIAVKLDSKYNTSVLEYLRYLVQSMRNNDRKSIYVFKVVDDTSGMFNGPYFKVINSKTSSDSLDTYELTIGYPSNNVVTSFNIDNNEAYSIFYNYTKKLSSNEYVQRIQDDGTISEIYAPIISSNNTQGITHSNEISWWNNVTEYPISASITLKGLLRPAVLMSKLRLNVLFYGKAHISSGLYIINKQVDNIDSSGFWTTLNLVRIDKDNQNFTDFLN
jgi:hypothetical protein